jgi:hypothetical protein
VGQLERLLAGERNLRQEQGKCLEDALDKGERLQRDLTAATQDAAAALKVGKCSQTRRVYGPMRRR